MPSLALSDLTRIAIKGHACPRCQGLMALVYVKPARIGYEQHVFEGITCEHTDSIVVENRSRYSGQ